MPDTADQNDQAVLRDFRDTLERIASHTPTCSIAAEEAWSNRQWALLFRDLQREARAVLNQHPRQI